MNLQKLMEDVVILEPSKDFITALEKLVNNLDISRSMAPVSKEITISKEEFKEHNLRMNEDSGFYEMDIELKHQCDIVDSIDCSHPYAIRCNEKLFNSIHMEIIPIVSIPFCHINIVINLGRVVDKFPEKVSLKYRELYIQKPIRTSLRKYGCTGIGFVAKDCYICER